MSNLRIGVPSKGRLAELSAELLKEAGLNFRRQERSLFARCREVPVDITFLRTDDIPVLCAEGAIDMGITGSDLVAESGADVVERLRLGAGTVRLSRARLPSARLRQADHCWALSLRIPTHGCQMHGDPVREGLPD